jgi:putative ABC transport system substrate-binding protein
MMGFVALANASSAKPIPRIGFLGWTPCADALASAHGEWAFVLKGLADFGYRPGDNVTIECRSANGRFDQFGAAANELVRKPVDIIIANSDPAANAAGFATHMIPIVAIQATLFGSSYGAPGGNMTGITDFNLELAGKRLEFLKDAIPTLRKIAVLSNPVGFYEADEAHTRRAGQELTTGLIFFRVKDAQALAETFAEMKAQNVDAVFVLPSLMFSTKAEQIADLAIKHDLATMVPDQRMTKAGCLMSYSSKADDAEQRLAFFVDHILKGTSPAVIPTERPSSFVLSINLRTARALGITLPRSVLMMADEVVE